jgi:hypothetical protein
MSILEKILNILFPRGSVFGNDFEYIDVKSLTKINPSKIKNRLICFDTDQNLLSIEISQIENFYSLLKKAKIDGLWDFSSDCAIIINNRIEKHLSLNHKNTIILFTPPDPKRLKLRGYHLPQKIVKRLNKFHFYSFYSIFYKHKHTTSQTELNKIEREKNLSNIFKINNDEFAKLKQKIISSKELLNLIIIDDVISTGSTLNELEKILAEYLCKNKLEKNVNIFSLGLYR